MIGQEELRNTLSDLIVRQEFPQFAILVGAPGSGKKTLAHWIFQKMSEYDGHIVLAVFGTGVDEVRRAIAESYRLQGVHTIYLFADADTMSVSAKNALLKITEEPPANAHFIMTLADENNTLDTIRSRATMFRMNTYTTAEIAQYSESNDDIILNVCETPGDVDILSAQDISKFYDFVKLVAYHIAGASISNAFKIADNVDIKGDGKGYDLRLFWKAFNYVLINSVSEYSIICRANAVAETNKALRMLAIRGINKQMLFDTWLLNVRDCLDLEE